MWPQTPVAPVAPDQPSAPKAQARRHTEFAALDKVKNPKPPAVIVGRLLLLLSFVCLTIVVFTHVAGMLHLFASMGWGLPDSRGHYLDFVSAVLGSILLIAGISRPRRREAVGGHHLGRRAFKLQNSHPSCPRIRNISINAKGAETRAYKRNLHLILPARTNARRIALNKPSCACELVHTAALRTP
jgi:hypothetical protein